MPKGQTDRTPDPKAPQPPLGRGRLRCYICGHPIRDHRVGFPCDKLPSQERLTSEGPQRKARNPE